MKKGILLTLLALVFSANLAFAQSHKGLYISEVMVQNDSSLVDEYGKHSAWIELYNSNIKTINISTIFITNKVVEPGTKTDLDKQGFINEFKAREKEGLVYTVPSGDKATKMLPEQYVVIFADGYKNGGPLHASITLTPGKDNWIIIYDTNKEDVIDQMLVPAAATASNNTFAVTNFEQVGRVNPFVPETKIMSPAEVTAGAANITAEVNQKIAKFAEKDPSGVGMAVMAMSVVFFALIILYLLFRIIGIINTKMSGKGEETAPVEAESSPVANSVADGEEIVAVCMALFEHLNAHDDESGVLTITPHPTVWNSKNSTLRELPRR